LNLDPDFCLRAHGEASAEFTIDAQAGRKPADAVVDEGECEKRDVVKQRDPRQPRTAPGERERNQRKRQEEVEEFGENEAQRVGF